MGKFLMINDSYNAYHNTLDTMCVYIYLYWFMAVLRYSNRIVTSQFNLYVYMYMHLSVCVLIVFYCLRPSWKIDDLSSEYMGPLWTAHISLSVWDLYGSYKVVPPVVKLRY